MHAPQLAGDLPDPTRGQLSDAMSLARPDRGAALAAQRGGKGHEQRDLEPAAGEGARVERECGIAAVPEADRLRIGQAGGPRRERPAHGDRTRSFAQDDWGADEALGELDVATVVLDRKSTRLNSSH